ncbi:hypothetical protein GIB67_026925 [Kingdonia uniflora]|uniref:glucan endo-1,3-beta-D-glucosidase n=1 Tax=Kingdonia uniflora TaxID=39325 RepID=A0A7J7P1M5_9MAGN|nr:hypothetical protein GIB67_026925 [Kingdonia uniflora]
MISHILFFITLLFAKQGLTNALGGQVGVNYGRIANNLPSAYKVIQLLKSQNINRVKLFDSDPSVLKSLSKSNISVIICVPNELLASVSNKQSFATKWVQDNILGYYPLTRITAIAVGNEVFVDTNNITEHLVPAMKNINRALVKFNIDGDIKVSSPIALSALQSSYPSSSGSFKPDLIEPVVKPMLEFLKETRSYLMVNIYPFFAYEGNSDVISLDYALFKENSGNVDSGNGLKYTSLLEAQLDAVYAAMSALKYDDIRIVVSETGWPSKGDENETGAGEENAAAYNGNLVQRVLTGGGTPLRPNMELDVYLFALFNENQKGGPTSERNYGLFYPNEEKVYDISLTAVVPTKQNNKGKVQAPKVEVHTPSTRGPTAVDTGATVTTTSNGQTWCVANGKLRTEKLQAGIDYACGEGGADCQPIQPGAVCYDPNTVEAHASYAFNSYYQKEGRAIGTCYFGGAAYVVTQPPSE